MNPAATTRVLYDGGVFLAPVFGDMLVTANQHTQVRVDGPPQMQVLVLHVSQPLPNVYCGPIPRISFITHNTETVMAVLSLLPQSMESTLKT